MLHSGTKVLNEPIVFFGSGPVAAASLELLATSFEIEAVITKPRPLHHHGSVPVLELAEKLGFPVITATDTKSLTAEIATSNFDSRLAILIDFGILVSKTVLDTFPLGIINSHFSLLPEWRGADPITFAILSGQHQTGVSLMLVVEAMDEGPLLAQTPYDIQPNETTPSLTTALVDASYQTIREIVPLYAAGAALAAPQGLATMAASSQPTYSRKLTKADSILNLSKSATILEREIRAYVEWPKTRTVIADKEVILTRAHVDDNIIGPLSLRGVFISGKQLCLKTADGTLVVDSLKPSGKKNMTAAAFLAGYGPSL